MRTLTFLLLALALTFVTSCKDDDTVYNTAADAGFSVGNEYEVGEPITFTDNTVPEEGTTIVSWLWKFGDEAGSTSNEQNPTFDLPCRTVFAAGQKEIEVVGPFPELEVEAAAVHEGYWD